LTCDICIDVITDFDEWLTSDKTEQEIVDFISEVKLYSETLNNEYIERIHQMSYSSLSDNGMLQIFSFLIK